MKNQLDVKFDEIYTRWRYFAVQKLQKHWILLQHMFCNGLICLKKIQNETYFSKLPYFVLFDKIILNVFWTDAKRLALNRLLNSLLDKKTRNLEKKASWSKISPLQSQLCWGTNMYILFHPRALWVYMWNSFDNRWLVENFFVIIKKLIWCKINLITN